MRRLLPVASMAALAACATPSQWEKPGVDQVAAQQDGEDCRRAAEREAFRYPSSPVFPYWGSYGPWRRRAGPFFLLQSSWASDRYFAENRLAAFCMRSRGYELVPVDEPKSD